MATIKYTTKEGGTFRDHEGVHSVLFPDGTRWDEVSGITDLPDGFTLIKSGAVVLDTNAIEYEVVGYEIYLLRQGYVGWEPAIYPRFKTQQIAQIVADAINENPNVVACIHAVMMHKKKK